MTQHDQEIDYLKENVSCAVVLERMPPVWSLDVKESTRDSLKYRRGDGEIVIVNHDGRGWWDPKSTAKGDVFGLVQHLDPGLNFGAVRRVLRPLAGLAPEFPSMPERRPSPRQRRSRSPNAGHNIPVSPVARRSGIISAVTAPCRIPLLHAAIVADAIREGPFGSAWFAHRLAGEITGIEMRGPAWRNFSKGGDKTLFRFAGEATQRMRLAVCESAIEALSLAAIEELRPDTLYTGTAGGIGPGTVAALQPSSPCFPAILTPCWSRQPTRMMPAIATPSGSRSLPGRPACGSSASCRPAASKTGTITCAHAQTYRRRRSRPDARAGQSRRSKKAELKNN